MPGEGSLCRLTDSYDVDISRTTIVYEGYDVALTDKIDNGG